MLDAILADIGGQAVGCSSAILTFQKFACAAGIVLAVGISVCAQWQGGNSGHRGAVYQRRAFEWSPGHHRKRRDDKFDHAQHFKSPQVNAGWFQRPYPYHLDYYRMRYGGSYAPYFGNLYGPPQVVTAPPYYGPYFGNYVNPADGAYGMPSQWPEGAVPQNNNATHTDTLPAPSQNPSAE
jgi:hypothetical protein